NPDDPDIGISERLGVRCAEETGDSGVARACLRVGHVLVARGALDRVHGNRLRLQFVTWRRMCRTTEGYSTNVRRQETAALSYGSDQWKAANSSRLLRNLHRLPICSAYETRRECRIDQEPAPIARYLHRTLAGT